MCRLLLILLRFTVLQCIRPFITPITCMSKSWVEMSQ